MTTKEQADAMARKCAESCHYAPITEQVIYDRIMAAIPLVELLEVARAANAVVDHAKIRHAQASQKEIDMFYALENLRKKGVEL